MQPSPMQSSYNVADKALFQTPSGLTFFASSAHYLRAIINAVDAAQHHVSLESYIFDFHGIVTELAFALEKAALRGVEVYVVVDGVGTPTIPTEWQKRFSAAGVKWLVFAPLGKLGLLIPSHWRRLHRKLCVVDDSIGFCGGINVLDENYDPSYGALPQPRLDFGMSVRGLLVKDIERTMLQLRLRLQSGELARSRKYKEALLSYYKNRRTHKKILFSPRPSNDDFLRPQATLLLRDNVRFRRRIETAYIQALQAAQYEVVIASAYFYPSRRLRQALQEAARRGVKVRLLLQGHYEYFMQFHAARVFYRALIQSGVQIFEYQKSLMHVKVAVVDPFHANPWATVGSCNLEPISFLLAREANIEVFNAAFAQTMFTCLDTVIAQDSKEILLHSSRPWTYKMRDRFASWVARAALFLTGNWY